MQCNRVTVTVWQMWRVQVLTFRVVLF